MDQYTLAKVLGTIYHSFILFGIIFSCIYCTPTFFISTHEVLVFSLQMQWYDMLGMIITLLGIFHFIHCFYLLYNFFKDKYSPGDVRHNRDVLWCIQNMADSPFTTPYCLYCPTFCFVFDEPWWQNHCACCILCYCSRDRTGRGRILISQATGMILFGLIAVLCEFVMFAVLMVHNVDQPDQVCQKIPESSYSLLCEILLCIFIYLQFHTMYLFCNMMKKESQSITK